MQLADPSLYGAIRKPRCGLLLEKAGIDRTNGRRRVCLAGSERGAGIDSVKCDRVRHSSRRVNMPLIKLFLDICFFQERSARYASFERVAGARDFGLFGRVCASGWRAVGPER